MPTQAELNIAVQSAVQNAVQAGCSSQDELAAIASTVSDEWQASVTAACEKNAAIDEKHRNVLIEQASSTPDHTTTSPASNEAHMNDVKTQAKTTATKELPLLHQPLQVEGKRQRKANSKYAQ